MNCQEFSQLVVSLTCDLPLTASERARALAHADTCDYCHARITQQQTLAAALQSLAQQEETIHAPEHVGQRLMAAFEQQKKPAVIPAAINVATPARTGFWAGFRLNWALATAATVLLLFAASVLWRRPAAPPVQQAKQAQEQGAPALAQKEIAFVQSSGTSTPPEQNIAQRAVARTTFKTRVRKLAPAIRPARNDEEGKGEFLALRPNLSAEPSEFEQIVRMQIPRTTLALWGVRVNEDSDNPKVNAEVVFGEDGVARAIRILN